MRLWSFFYSFLSLFLFIGFCVRNLFRFFSFLLITSILCASVCSIWVIALMSFPEKFASLPTGDGSTRWVCSRALGTVAVGSLGPSACMVAGPFPFLGLLQGEVIFNCSLALHARPGIVEASAVAAARINPFPLFKFGPADS